MIMKKANKKAQITIFIILGILMLLGSATIFYIKSHSSEENVSPEKVYKVPEEARPIYDYMTACLRDKTKEALIIAGEQGGYIYPEEAGLIANFDDQTESNSVSFMKGDNYIIPYYLYMKSKNTCQEACAFDSEMPLLKQQGDGKGLSSSIDSQIEFYLLENLEDCVDNFAEFKKLGYIITPQKDPTVKVTITKNEVMTSMDYPLTISKGGIESNIDKFITHTPIRLQEIYELAKIITDTQAKKGFFEAQTITLIAVFSDRDTSALPPMADYTWGLNERLIWRKAIVKEQIKTILTGYTPIIRFGGALNDMYYYPSGMSDSSKGIYHQMRVDPNTGKTYPFSVGFSYFPSWEPYFDVNPNNGEIIQAEKVSSDFLNLLGMSINRYEFKYDVSYPIIVKIRDPLAFNEEGYDFVFALEANLRNNQFMTNNQSITQVTTPLEGSFACNENQLVSGNITISAIDGKTNLPLDEAHVYYQFGEESCYIGQTKMDQYNKSAKVTGKFPKGIGQIVIKKEDYLSTMKLYGVKKGKTETVALKVYPMEEKTVEFMLKNLDKAYLNDKALGWYLTPTAYKPGSKITMMATFTRVPDSLSSQTLKKTVMLTSTSRGSTNVTLAPGKYEVKVFTLDSENVTIPEKRVTECTVDIGICWDSVSYIINATNLVVATTAEFNNNTAYYDLSAQTLYNNNNQLTVYGVYFNLRGVNPPENREYEDLKVMSNMDSYVKLYYGQLMPR